ncbi:ATP/GTP-binding protein [Pseudarthrobacter sp. PS3-L1]|uniref:ATP/GTP-binding protein n=1 Tax=Pseudarthrobacter sp. PS3-L1 TaxID=3046207 RepID=UPI0024B9A5AC|nr:ATP/GTP-binding protein [Pseudarthrobacter sp. PS3-L1]MDJ0321970.1 ATP/GTP-binding protein [Pseudarthrobacter sp. PS3-L1]
MAWMKITTRRAKTVTESKPTPKKSAAKKPVRVVGPGPRGWSGRGGGMAQLVPSVKEYRGTTVQVCGLWPFSSGASSPMIGVPLGRHEETQATVCCDPISWFQRARLISNPSAFILGRPGLGKSTVVRRMFIGLSAQGVNPLILGDLKGEHVKAVRALGGQVISVGSGVGYLNILDPGQAVEVAKLLEEGGHHKDAARVRADAHSRRLAMIVSLITISRNNPPTDQEQTILDRALRVLDEKFEGIPVLKDLLDVIVSAPDELRQVALDRGDINVYLQETRALEATLLGLTGGGKLGEIFSQHTTEPMMRDRAVVFDVSSIDPTDMELQAAVLLACWSYGFGTINVANALADVGLEPRRNYFVVLDELWRALRAGKGMVDRVDALTRLNRSVGVGQIMISHTMSDLLALPAEEDRMKARGFVERSGMVICGGLPASEMPLLTAAVPLSNKEQKKLISWQDPPAWDSRGTDIEPPGRGKFLIKVGGRPGIPVVIGLTSLETGDAGVNDTEEKWHAPVPVSVLDSGTSELSIEEGTP